MDLGYIKAILQEAEGREPITKQISEKYDDLKKRGLEPNDNLTNAYVFRYNELQEYLDVQLGIWELLGDAARYIAQNPVEVPAVLNIDFFEKKKQLGQLKLTLDTKAAKILERIKAIRTSQDVLDAHFEQQVRESTK